jgi:hypothetical protein
MYENKLVSVREPLRPQGMALADTACIESDITERASVTNNQIVECDDIR